MELNIRGKIRDYMRVLRITRKPGWSEFAGLAKITGIGLILIGFIGFLVYLFGIYTGIFY